MPKLHEVYATSSTCILTNYCQQTTTTLPRLTTIVCLLRKCAQKVQSDTQNLSLWHKRKLADVYNL